MPVSLEEIVAYKQQEVLARKAEIPLSVLESQVQPALQPRFTAALQTESGRPTRLILEVKPASPSAGTLVDALDLAQVLDSYNRFASAISVLTDKRYFNGSLDLLTRVKQGSPHPVLCKDFVLDPYQVVEARKSGADAVLLIVKILSHTQLKELYAMISDFGMTPVVEIQNEAELERALNLQPDVLLINNRNLQTFEIDLETTLRLAPQIPQGIVTISASGITSRLDLDLLRPVASCFLIGSALMKTPTDRLSQTLEALVGP